MDHEEFSQLLEAYTFGNISPVDQRRLAAAVLESAERAQDFAEAQEMREQLMEPGFRKELLDILAEQTPWGSQSWWRTLLQPRILAPLAGTAVAVAVVTVLVVRGRPVGVPETPIISVQNTVAVSASGNSRESPDTAQVAPRTPDIAQAAPRTPVIARVVPKTPDTAQVAPKTGVGLGSLTVANMKVSSVGLLGLWPAEHMAAAFGRAAIEGSGVELTLPGGSRYAPSDSVSVRVELPVEARMYAIVRGPAGAIRQLYPASTEEDRPLPPGLHLFSFAATPRPDPEEGGVSTLRVFAAPKDLALPPGQNRWRWIAANASFGQAEYTVQAPQ